MTLRETGTIMDLLTAAYPRFYAGISEKRRHDALTMWAVAFERDDYRLVLEAVRGFINSDERGFPPVPGQIKSKIRLITERGEMTELEAWGIVAKALRNSGYGAKEEFDKFPPVIKRIVGSPAQLREWGMMDSETVHSVLASNFQRSYRAIAAKEREIAALPPDVQELAAQIAAAKSMPELPAENPEQLPEPKRESVPMPEHVKRTLEAARNPEPKSGKRHMSLKQIIAALKAGNT